MRSWQRWRLYGQLKSFRRAGLSSLRLCSSRVNTECTRYLVSPHAAFGIASMRPDQSMQPLPPGLAYEFFQRVTCVLPAVASSAVWLILFSLGTMEMSSSEQRSVKIVESGPSGSIEYRDSAGSMTFYWEFGGGETVAIIWIGDLASWSNKYPWAIDYRARILERVAREVIRQKAPTCRSDIDEKDG